MTKKNLVTAIIIMACGALLLLPLFLPFFSYKLDNEFIEGGPKIKESYVLGLLDSDFPRVLGNHFRNFTSRSWLLLVSDANIVVTLITIIVGISLAILEALQFAKMKFYKTKKWVGLALFVLGCLVLALSLVFFIFSSNVTKDAITTTEGFTISAFHGHVGWYFVVFCSIIGGWLAFKRPIKKEED